MERGSDGSILHGGREESRWFFLENMLQFLEARIKQYEEIQQLGEGWYPQTGLPPCETVQSGLVTPE